MEALRMAGSLHLYRT